MSHQPFETWLFSDDSLETEQQVALESHLESCDQCHRMTVALSQVIETISTSTNPEPSPGFTQRWYQHLAEARQKHQRQRIWLFVLGLFALALLIFLCLFLLNLNQFNWSYGLGQFIATVSLVANRGSKALQTVNSITRAVPALIPIMVIFGVGSLSAAFALILTWFSAIIKLYQPATERR